MAASQPTEACWHGQDDLLTFKPSIRMRKKGDLSDFVTLIVGARQDGIGIKKTAHSHKPISRVYRE